MLRIRGDVRTGYQHDGSHAQTPSEHGEIHAAFGWNVNGPRAGVSIKNRNTDADADILVHTK